MIYCFWGKVKKSEQRGQKLGFPTANINLTKKILEGVYISKTKIDKKLYPSLTFIGKAQTFNERQVKAESYILDFNENIYSKWISIKLLKKIRNNQKFNSPKDLIIQINKDIQATRKYFKIS